MGGTGGGAKEQQQAEQQEQVRRRRRRPAADADAAIGPPGAALALSLCRQPWPDLGLDLDLGRPSPGTAADADADAASSFDISPIVDRIAALLLVRIVALVNTNTAAAAAAAADEVHRSLVDYPDLSTTAICRTELDRAARAEAEAEAAEGRGEDQGENQGEEQGIPRPPRRWPQPAITPAVLRQLHDYVRRICAGYRAVHYHSVEHCYHVTLSASKLLDLMLCEGESGSEGECEGESESECGADADADADAAANATVDFRERRGGLERQRRRQREAQRRRRRRRRRRLYGLRDDPLTHLAFVFSALIHDVDHTGITNRQLVDEADDLALLYNDQSVAEQRSLAVAFSALLSPDFDRLRDVMFASPGDYQRFRRVVIDLVLTTDIASPERTQIVKSKWREAFPSAAHAARAEQREQQRRRSSMAASSAIRHRRPAGGGSRAAAGRSSPPPIVERVGEEAGAEEEEEDDDDDDESKSEFFRDRVSMGLGYMKGETDSVSNRAFGVSIAQSHRLSTDSQGTRGQSSAFHGVEEEDEISSDGLSIGTDTSSSVEGGSSCNSGDKDEPNDDSNVGAVVSGATLSKLDIEERDKFDPSAPLGLVSDDFRHQTQSVRGNVHPSIQRAVDNVSRGQGWNRAASDRRLLVLPTQDQSRLQPSRNKKVGSDGKIDLRAQLIRRFSLPNMTKAPKYELRLGIRRAVDLTGQPIETYAPRPVIKRIPSRDSLDALGDVDEESEDEEYDELKVSAVLEHCIKAADVAALMQSYDNLLKWSSRLFREQKASAVEARGDDPEASWFEGQLVFMDVYVLPLANNLRSSGIFDDKTGSLFVQCVQDNRARWLIEGRRKTDDLIADWKEKHT